MLEELAELTGAEPVVVGPVEGVELAVPVDGALPVVELAGADAVMSLLLGVVAVVLLVELGTAAVVPVGLLDEVIEEPETEVEGWLVVDELDAVLLQLSEIIFTESTFSEFMSVESGAPVNWTVCPTCAVRSWVFPVSFQFLPELSTNV